MTIASETSRNNYTGNGATATYSYGFKIFQQGDLLVTVQNTSGTETTLTLTTDYTVSGVGETAGGSISLVNSGQAWLLGGFLRTGYLLTIRRVCDLIQTTDIRNEGLYRAAIHEDRFDKLVMIDQQQQDTLGRCIVAPETDTNTNLTLPTPSARADKVLGFNSSGGMAVQPVSSFGLTSFQTRVGDPSAPSDGQVWYDTAADLYRGCLNGSNITFNTGASGGGGGTTIDVSAAAGANLGEKLLAAYNSLPAAGGVLDCRLLTGTQSTGGITITLAKKVEIILGACTLTVTAGPWLTFSDGVSFADRTGSADGSILRGSGQSSIIRTDGTAVPITLLVQAYDVCIRDLQCHFSAANASSIFIDFAANAAKTNNIISLHVANLDMYSVAKNSASHAGIAMRFLHCYGRTVIRDCHIQSFQYGLYFRASTTNTGGNGAFTVLGNRIYYNDVGIYGDATAFNRCGLSGIYLVGNTLEGNSQFGLRTLGTFHLATSGNHWEQVDGVATAQIQMDAIAADTFGRTVTCSGDQWNSAVPAVICNQSTYRVFMFGTSGSGEVVMNSGICRRFGCVTLSNQDVGNVSDWAGIGFAGVDNTNKIIGPSSVNFQISGWGAFNLVDAASATLMNANLTTSNVGFGRSSLSYELVTADRTFTDTGATQPAGIGVTVSANPGGASSAQVRAIRANAVQLAGNAQSVSTIQALSASVDQQSALGTITNAYAMHSRVLVSGGGAITTSHGLRLDCYLTAGTINDHTAVNIQPATVVAGTVNTWTSLSISDPNNIGAVSTTAVRVYGGACVFNASFTAAGTFNIRGTADTNLFITDPPSDTMGIGAVVDTNSKLRIFWRRTDTSGTRQALNVLGELNPGADSSQTMRGVSVTGGITSANAWNCTGTVEAASFVCNHSGTATATTLRGITVRGACNSTGPITTLHGLHVNASAFSTGNVTTARGIECQIVNTGTATMTTAQALYIAAPNNTGSVITTYVGLDLLEATGGTITTNIAMRVGAGGNANGFYISGSSGYVAIRSSSPSAMFHVTQKVETSGSPAAFKVTGGAHTTLAAGAEAVDCDFVLNRTVEFATGAITSQRAVLFRAPTYGFVGASTVTDCATVSIAGTPTAGTNATLTRKYALWISGTHATTSPSLRCDSAFAMRDTGQSISAGGLWAQHIQSSGRLLWSLNTDANGAFASSTPFVSFDGANTRIDFLNSSTSGATYNLADINRTGSSPTGILFTAGAHQDLANAEFSDTIFSLAATANFVGGGGAVATQRSFIISGRTYTADAAQTLTDAATVAITAAPTAGANITITRGYSLWCQAGRARFDGGVVVGAEPTGIASTVSYTNTVDNSANSTGTGTILFKGTTNRNSSGFLKILDGTTARYIPYFDAITG